MTTRALRPFALVAVLAILGVAAACSDSSPTSSSHAPVERARFDITPKDTTGGVQMNGGPGEPGDEPPPDTTKDGGTLGPSGG